MWSFTYALKSGNLPLRTDMNGSAEGSQNIPTLCIAHERCAMPFYASNVKHLS